MKIWFEFDDNELKQRDLDLNKYYIQLLIAKSDLEADKLMFSGLIDTKQQCGILVNENQEKTTLISLIGSISSLMKPENKNSKLWLLDLDVKDTSELESMIHHFSIDVVKKYESVKGWHYVTKSFDTRIMKDVKFLEIKKDALILLNVI